MIDNHIDYNYSLCYYLFDCDVNFVMRLREYKEYIENGPLIIKTAEITRFGSGNVYKEVVPPKNSNHLTFESAKVV